MKAFDKYFRLTYLLTQEISRHKQQILLQFFNIDEDHDKFYF